MKKKRIVNVENEIWNWCFSITTPTPLNQTLFQELQIIVIIIKEDVNRN